MALLAGAPIELLHPPLDRPSGGNVCDRCLLDAAARLGFRLGFPMFPVVVGFDEIETRFHEAAPAFRIWDGLLLEALAQRRHALPPGNRGVLLHWLASLDPALDAIERGRLESIERTIVEAATIVVVPGEDLQRTLRRRHPQRVVVRCEPAVREAFRARRRRQARRASGCVELLTVSNLLPAKGLVELLPILASLDTLDWRWHLVGDRDVDPECARRFDEASRRLGLAHRIVLHGPLDADGVVERMDRADVFVFPSRFESYGLALAEAAARALPVVAFRVGDAERMFRDGVDALLVPVGDRDAFAMTLRRAIVDASLRTRLHAKLASRAPARAWDEAFAGFAAAVREAAVSCPPPSRP